MKIRLLRCTWIVLLLLLCICTANSNKKRQKSISKSSDLIQTSNTGGLKGCKTVQGVTTCNPKSTKTYAMSKSTIFLVSSFIGSFIIIAIYSSQKERTRRQSIIEKEFKIYKEKANKSLLNPEQKQNFVSDFKNKNYQIVISIKENQQKNFCSVKILDFKQETEDVYSIKMSGNDDVGKSLYQGILIFKDRGFGLKLSKVYANRTKAEQTGKFDIILLEGEGNQELIISGNWAFYGFENVNNFSGTWTMQQITSEK